MFLEIQTLISGFFYALTWRFGNLNSWNNIRFKRRIGRNWTSLDKTPLILKMKDLFEKRLCRDEPGGWGHLFIPEAVTFLGHTMVIEDPDGKTATFKRFDGTRDTRDIVTFEIELRK